MLYLGLTFLIAGIALWKTKRPSERVNSSRLYRIDNRVVGTVLLVLAACLFVLGLTELRPIG